MGLQVLIVDDSASMRSILKKAVTLTGYEIGGFHEGGNGREALEILAREWIDVILLDMNMPVMDGLTMLRELQTAEIVNRIPVVMVTTEGRMQPIQEAFRLGAKAHVKKPFQPEQIRGVLQEILGGEYARENAGDAEGSDF